ncbi:hypothetical protein DBR43_03305 [Pedobacter sp. KBW06]|uniref:hypothetical protein n=1 Tax=Pedobacter sp. KBW06 TaxID=2153359 RepID=UPI000F59BA5E|nr:hypothetical protein [Pedobacter sp. KBW06]RQO74434.1 hypothetical protein DBR43_03305 [Pedobacter sp. KBW06]
MKNLNKIKIYSTLIIFVFLFSSFRNKEYLSPGLTTFDDHYRTVPNVVAKVELTTSELTGDLVWATDSWSYHKLYICVTSIPDDFNERYTEYHEVYYNEGQFSFSIPRFLIGGPGTVRIAITPYKVEPDLPAMGAPVDAIFHIDGMCSMASFGTLYWNAYNYYPSSGPVLEYFTYPN